MAAFALQNGKVCKQTPQAPTVAPSSSGDASSVPPASAPSPRTPKACTQRQGPAGERGQGTGGERRLRRHPLKSTRPSQPSCQRKSRVIVSRGGAGRAPWRRPGQDSRPRKKKKNPPSRAQLFFVSARTHLGNFGSPHRGGAVAGARGAAGAPCVLSVSLIAARRGTPVPVLPVVAASAPAARVLAAPRAKPENPIPSPSATCRSGRAPRARPSSEAGAAAAGAGARAGRCRRPRWGAGRGRGGRGRLPGRDPRAQHPALPSHLPRRPLASLAASCPARLGIEAQWFSSGFRAPRLAGTLGSDAEGCDFSCVVVCVHRQDR